jgi:hypothetical protein
MKPETTKLVCPKCGCKLELISMQKLFDLFTGKTKMRGKRAKR